MNMLVFNFENMMDLQKGYVYQISILLLLGSFSRVQRNLSKQNNMNKIQNKLTCQKIEPYFYEVVLCPIAT
jgi:hypothetical protein